MSETTLSRILRALGYRKLSARPRHHAQAAGAVDAFKKRSPTQGAARIQRMVSIHSRAALARQQSRRLRH